jgi:delta8-fatty-acid desaturase
MTCSYHLPKTQRLMTAYRIGTVELPWINLTPPLQGGVHRKYPDPSDTLQIETVEDDGSDWSSGETAVGWSSSVSTNTEPIESEEQCPACQVEGEKCISPDKTTSCNPARTNLSVKAYTAMLEAREVAEAIKEYPSLDLETQQNISKEYRALHQRIIDEGYYKCNYSAYGRDSIRFGILFGCFLALLYSKWYLTSAVFLGMFWVRY